MQWCPQLVGGTTKYEAKQIIWNQIGSSIFTTEATIPKLYFIRREITSLSWGKYESI
ncbi:hypothetical protein IMPERIA75_180037 [Imperialibacter sp. 75]|nr:hypothetical protein IMPERIA75_180037 [Imperialibacter sp. 75]